jgi:hypothetical protein
MNKKKEILHLKIKKRRFKLLYKKLINIKKNVLNRTKVINFKKKKWQKFIGHLEKTSLAKKQDYQFYDQSCDYVSDFQSRFKWGHKNTVQCKSRFSFFYGYLLKKYIKTRVKIAKQNNKVLKKKFWILSKIFINFFEKRLDTTLFRCNFAYSMRHAKQLISHKHIRVNGKTININSYQVKNGDLIDLVPQKRFLINLHNFTYFISNFWPIPTKHLQINYRTYQIIFIEDFSLNPLISSFPFYLNLNSVIKSYS